MNREIEAYEGELTELREKNQKLTKIIEHMFDDREGIYFISGEFGEKDSMGLPESIMICPAHGLDGVAVYTKTKDYTGPQW